MIGWRSDKRQGGAQMKTAGLDIGTTGCKCTVFDEAGDFLGTAYRSYPTQQEGGRRMAKIANGLKGSDVMVY